MFIAHDYYELANLAPGYEAGYTILDLFNYMYKIDARLLQCFPKLHF